MKMKIIPIALAISAALSLPVIADTTSASDSFNQNRSTAVAIDNSRELNRNVAVDSRVDTSRTISNSSSTDLTRQYLMSQQYRKSNQQLESNRNYSSGVGQEAGNQGAATGHSMNQNQGSVSVGSLVTETHSDSQRGASGSGSYWQYAPQSNNLSVAGDNYAPVSLSNINANGGNIHIGDINKGNLYDSQIGNNQYGAQGGGVANSQSNSQQQDADSSATSSDKVSN
ncbi:MAG: hypothetical protein V7739_08325 [Motiliproteus sp.]